MTTTLTHSAAKAIVQDVDAAELADLLRSDRFVTILLPGRSRRHAVIDVRPGSVRITDGGSVIARYEYNAPRSGYAKCDSVVATGYMAEHAPIFDFYNSDRIVRFVRS